MPHEKPKRFAARSRAGFAELKSPPRKTRPSPSALDNSLVVWGNEIADGRHGTNGLPIVLLGGAAGRLNSTGYMVDVGTQPHHRLGCTLHNIMGDPTEGFGAVPDCGVLQGLDLA